MKVQSSKDAGAATFQTAAFYAGGRRAKKVVTRSGSHDGAAVYLYDGQRIMDTRKNAAAVSIKAEDST